MLIFLNLFKKLILNQIRLDNYVKIGLQAGETLFEVKVRSKNVLV